MDKPSYIGRITQSGVQKIKAPRQVKGPKGTKAIKRGSDLRSGK